MITPQQYTTGTPSTQQQQEQPTEFRVLGIALIVDQLGKGPRMIVRYPSAGGSSRNNSRQHNNQRHTTPNNSTATNSKLKPPNHQPKQSLNSSTTINISSGIHSGGGFLKTGSNTDTGNSSTNTKNMKGSSSSIPVSKDPKQQYRQSLNTPPLENLFYQLSGRQMSKLFRPKPALCGQPITLTIDQTYFCCRAVLMNNHTTTGIITTTDSATTTTATTTTTSTTSDAINNNDADGSGSNQQQPSDSIIKDQPLVLFSIVVAVAPSFSTAQLWMPSQISTTGPTTSDGDSGSSKNNPIFPCIRRVHLTLARLCRVLEREERRCRYVSCQSTLYEQIRTELSSSSTTTGGNKMANATVANAIPKDTTTAVRSSFTNNNSLSTSTASSPKPILDNNTTTTVTTNNAVITTSHRRTGSFSFSSLDTIAATVQPQATTTTTTTLPNTSMVVSLSDSIKKNDSSGGTPTDPQQQPQGVDEMAVRAHELEQIILESIMTAPPTRYRWTSTTTTATSHDDDDDDDVVEMIHVGNLAQELSQVYHAFAAVPSSRDVVGRDMGVVYINGHIAVTIEAATIPVSIINQQQQQQYRQLSRGSGSNTLPTHPYDVSASTSNSIIRPYMTLLFPHSSPDQILDSLRMPSSDGTTTTTSRFTQQNQQQQLPSRIQEFLLVWSPQKSLSDMAKEIFIPLQATLDIATQLVRQGFCVISPVLSYAMCFACPNIRQIQQVTLPFYQKFGISNINLFVLISYITESDRTFGMSISQLIHHTTHPSNTNNPRNDNNISDNHRNSNDNDLIHTVVRIPIVTSISSRLSTLSLTSSISPSTIVENDDDGTVPPLALWDDSNNNNNHHQVAASMEELVHQMIVWLCSHRVIAPIQEYLVLIHPNPTSGGGGTTSIMIPSPMSQFDRTISGTTTFTPLHREERSHSVPIVAAMEERKNDEIAHLSFLSRRTLSDQNSRNEASNVTNQYNSNSSNDDDDEYILHNILVTCFNVDNSTNRKEHRPSPPPPPPSVRPVVLLECCYRTGFDERFLRAFVTRNSNYLRIVYHHHSSD